MPRSARSAAFWGLRTTATISPGSMPFCSRFSTMRRPRWPAAPATTYMALRVDSSCSAIYGTWSFLPRSPSSRCDLLTGVPDPVRVGARPSGALRLCFGLKGCLNLDRNLDLVADEEPAGLEGGVPVQPVILTVDLRPGLESDLLIAPRVASRAEVLALQLDRLCDAAKGKLAYEREAVARNITDFRALEGDGGVLVRLEEVGRTEVVVALAIVGRNRRGLCSGFCLEGREVVRRHPDNAFELLEAAADFAEAEMADRKAKPGVGRVDNVGLKVFFDQRVHV